MIRAPSPRSRTPGATSTLDRHLVHGSSPVVSAARRPSHHQATTSSSMRAYSPASSNSRAPTLHATTSPPPSHHQRSYAPSGFLSSSSALLSASSPPPSLFNNNNNNSSSTSGNHHQQRFHDPTLLVSVSNARSAVGVSQFHRPPSWATTTTSAHDIANGGGGVESRRPLLVVANSFESSLHSSRLASQESRPQIVSVFQSSTGGIEGRGVGGVALKRRASAAGEASSPSIAAVNNAAALHDTLLGRKASTALSVSHNISSDRSRKPIVNFVDADEERTSNALQRRLQPNRSNSFLLQAQPTTSGDGGLLQSASTAANRRSSQIAAGVFSGPGPAGGSAMQADDAPRYQTEDRESSEKDPIVPPQPHEEDELRHNNNTNNTLEHNSTLDSFQWPPLSNSVSTTPVGRGGGASAETTDMVVGYSRHLSGRGDDDGSGGGSTFLANDDDEKRQVPPHSAGSTKKKESTLALLLAENFVSSPRRNSKQQRVDAGGDENGQHGVRNNNSGGGGHRFLGVPNESYRQHNRTQSDDNSWIERMLHDHPSIARGGGESTGAHEDVSSSSWMVAADSISSSPTIMSPAAAAAAQRGGGGDHLMSTLSFRPPPSGQSTQTQQQRTDFTSSSLPHSFLVDASSVYEVLEEVVMEPNQPLPTVVISNNDGSTSDENGDDDAPPMHERPMSILLRRKSAPLPRREEHHTPDMHLDVVEHPESFSSSISASPIPSASNSPEGGGGSARRDRRSDNNAAYFPASPEVEKEYPAALMLWRRRASEMNLLAPATNSGTSYHQQQQVQPTTSPSDSSGSKQQSPPRRDAAHTYHVLRERVLHHSGPSAHSSNNNNNFADDTSSSQLLSSSDVSAFLHQWMDNEYHPNYHQQQRLAEHAATTPHSYGYRSSMPPQRHAAAAPHQTDEALVREHKVIMQDLREVRGATYKLDQQLQSCRNEGQHHRGKLAAMNYATEARLAAVRRVTLEIEATKLHSRESASRADIFAEWSSKLEQIHREVILSWRMRRQADIVAAEADHRAAVVETHTNALDDLRVQFLNATVIAETQAQLRIALETLERTWEPAARHDIVSHQEQCRNALSRAAVEHYFFSLQEELLRAENDVRNMMDLFHDDEVQQILVEKTNSHQAAMEREARRLADEMLQQGSLQLSRLEGEIRLQLESEERKEFRNCYGWFEKMVQFMKDRISVDDEAASARANVEENETNMWRNQILADFHRGAHVAHQREMIRVCFEQRAAQLRLEDEERHELVVAERKGKWEAEDAYRRRIEMEMSTMRHGHRQALSAFESHAATLVDIVRVEETDERDNILQMFEVQLNELHERERYDSHKRFLAHQEEQRDALAAMESEFRLDVNEAENAARFSQLQKQYRQELVISRLFETERTLRQAIVDQQRASFAMDITSEMEPSCLAALERQRLREAREAEYARMAALRVKATNSAPFLGFSLAEKIASSSADKRLVNAAGIATLVVDSLVIGGPAFTSGLRLHDRIVTVKGMQPTSLVAVRQTIAKGATPGELFEVVVRRQKRRSTVVGDVELDEEGLTARSLAGEVDFGNFIDDDIMSETSSSSQQNSPGRSGSLTGSEKYETLTFYVPVKTVNAEFTDLHDLFFDLTDTQRIERNAPTPGYVTRSKKNFSEKLNSGRTSTEHSNSITSAGGSARPRAATISTRMSSPSVLSGGGGGLPNGSFASPLLRPSAGTVITAPPLNSTSVSPADAGYTPSPDLVRHATSLPRPE
ncbi:Hypothetical protein, putative [Bodo saltans]|uniref:PDZ domain-containing protein n=1 Tax=Bodo saltans TaxID=75058 RepID=A0A0S4JB32_BODSA|nr:Hypothetical protein, putative [Bodo saltans]|eukprot:CUG87146.1 Hypothetical protein, putative [Bodo saltans]